MEELLNENQDEIDSVTENELKKIKLSLEHGMDFSKSFTSPELPPEIEGQFLNHIQQWEDQYAQRKMITVHSLLGEPSFIPVSKIPDDEIEGMLDDAKILLGEHNIVVDTLCEVDVRELYRFITEELLVLEIADIRIEGMMHHFTYEEFHPNHPYDIKNRCTEFIEYIADKEKDETIVPWGVGDEITSNGQVLKKNELNDHIVRFRELFSSLILIESNYISVTLSDTNDEATAVVFVHYSGVTDGIHMAELTGNCIFNLKCDYGWWTIHQFETPWEIA